MALARPFLPVLAALCVGGLLAASGCSTAVSAQPTPSASSSTTAATPTATPSPSAPSQTPAEPTSTFYSVVSLTEDGQQIPRLAGETVRVTDTASAAKELRFRDLCSQPSFTLTAPSGTTWQSARSPMQAASACMEDMAPTIRAIDELLTGSVSLTPTTGEELLVQREGLVLRLRPAQG